MTPVSPTAGREPSKFPAFFQIKRYYEHSTDFYWWSLCIIHTNEQLATLSSLCDRDAMQWRIETYYP